MKEKKKHESEIIKPIGFGQLIADKTDKRSYDQLIYDMAYEVLNVVFVGDVNNTCHNIEDFEQCSDWYDFCMEQAQKIIKDELKGFLLVRGEQINLQK